MIPNFKKMLVAKVGGFSESGLPVDWEFDGSDCPETPGVWLTSTHPDDQFKTLYGGYTIAELREVVAAAAG